MKKIVSFLSCLFLAGVVNAAPIVIDPITGLSGSFSFGGAVGSLQTDPVDGWEITVGTDSYIDVFINDCCDIGDEFALVLDDAVIPWTSFTPSDDTTGTLFSGEIIDLFLSAGTHTFDVELTAACCTSGGADITFSSVRPVPAPTTLALLGLGLAGIGYSRKKHAG